MTRHVSKCLDNWVITLDSSEEQHREIIRGAIERRAYAIFENRGSVHGFDLDDWKTAEQEVLQSDFKGNASEFRILIACPRDADITTILSFTSHSLVVFHARKKQKEEAKQGPGVFSVYAFPEEIVPAEADVKASEGVLQVRLPKKNGAHSLDKEREIAAGRRGHIEP